MSEHALVDGFDTGVVAFEWVAPGRIDSELGESEWTDSELGESEWTDSELGDSILGGFRRPRPPRPRAVRARAGRPSPAPLAPPSP